jgi:probable F420-dependent oxidoreductase
MKFGVVFPQTEFGNDPLAIRDYAQTVEGLGLSHVLAYDHVLGANPDRPGGWQGPYTFENPFHEPFVLFSHMAAVTQTIGFIPGVIILPQRQTALVAKQAATLDVLSGGRLRLGVGIGWNKIEYVALNQDFHTRGRRVEEQVDLLRQLWTKPLLDFTGQEHRIPDAGLNPLPVQRPIPIWFGGHAERALRRVARMGDGWLPLYRTPEESNDVIDRLDRYLAEAGRRRADIGIEPRLQYGDGDPATWTAQVQTWEALGATHISLNTMGVGFATPAAHLAVIRRFAETFGLKRL